MKEEYGEHYAQKVEDRLLHYLQKLETVLPGDTYIDKIMKKEGPLTEEEKLLLEVVTTDSTNIAATLKKLLHCDVASCHLSSISQSSAHGLNGMESSQPLKSALYGSSSKAFLKPGEAQIPLQFQPDVFGGVGEAEHDVSKDSPLLLDSDSDVCSHPQTEVDEEAMLQEDSSDKEKKELSQGSSESVQESPSSTQFCSKHQRWVKSILQECPDECSEELLLHVSLSPPLFQSSSSITSSQDLTPSDLMPCPPNQQQPPSETSTTLQTAANPGSNQASLNEEPTSASSGPEKDASQLEYLPHPSASRDTQLPVLWSPVVKLIDIASVGHPLHHTLIPHRSTLNHVIKSSNIKVASSSSLQGLQSPHSLISRNRAIFDQQNNVVPKNPPNTRYKVQTDPVSLDASTSTSCQPQTGQRVSKLTRVFRACTSMRLNRCSQNPLTEQLEKALCCPPLPNFNISGPLTKDVSTSTSQLVCVMPLLTNQSQQSIKPHPHTPSASPIQTKTPPNSAVISSASNSDFLAVRSETSRPRTDQLRLSLPSQAVLLQSKLLQPSVTLTRLSTQECYRVTKWKSSTRYEESMVQDSSDDRRAEEEKEEEDADFSFDLNTLYSSHFSSNDSEDSRVCDPDYKPFKGKTFFRDWHL